MIRLTTLLILLVAALTACQAPPSQTHMPMHVYIVHGYAASPSDHWFPWLKKALESRGATVSILSLPSPNNPQTDEWQQALEAQVTKLNKQTYFVGHSLGGIALLRYLENTTHTSNIGGYILVSGFNASLPILPQLDHFITPDINYPKLVEIAEHRVVIAASNDYAVPISLSKDLADALDAEFSEVADGGHFLGSDGYTSFPLLLETLEKLSK
jgi:uncharacterized protein